MATHFFRTHFLFNQFHREQRGQGLGADGLPGARVQGRQGFVGHVGHDVVPVLRHLFLRQNNLAFHVKRVF
jgi:hypothetical protein